VKGEKIMKRWLLSVLAVGLLASGLLATGCTTTQQGTTALGAGTGAILGAAIARGNPALGAVVGGMTGAMVGAAMGEVIDDAARRAANTGEPVVIYDGPTTVESRPVSEPYYAQSTTCRKIRTRVWENGVLKTDRVEEICEGVQHRSDY
jgi:phage tail tape-measure protein